MNDLHCKQKRDALLLSFLFHKNRWRRQFPSPRDKGDKNYRWDFNCLSSGIEILLVAGYFFPSKLITEWSLLNYYSCGIFSVIPQIIRFISFNSIRATCPRSSSSTSLGSSTSSLSQSQRLFQWVHKLPEHEEGIFCSFEWLLTLYSPEDVWVLKLRFIYRLLDGYWWSEWLFVEAQSYQRELSFIGRQMSNSCVNIAEYLNWRRMLSGSD